MVPFINTNFPDGGGDGRAIQFCQVPQRQQLLHPRQRQRIVLCRAVQLVQLSLQRLLLRVIVGAVAEVILLGDQRILIVLISTLAAALNALQGGFQFCG